MVPRPRSSAKVRPLGPADFARVQGIECRAGERFRDIEGLEFIADHDPPSTSVLDEYVAAGQAWTAVDETDSPLGYLLIDVLDGRAHIEQVSVHPDAQGHGVGRLLVEHALEWASRLGSGHLTLNTFCDLVPWNAPLYRHLGFVEMPGEEIGPDLERVCQREANQGLEPGLRVTMWAKTKA